MYGQDLTVFTDANNRLHLFEEGVFTQIYYQPTQAIHVGNKYVCFVDSKGDIYTYYYGDKELIAQTHQGIEMTDNLLLVQTSGVLRVFDQGIKHVLTSNATRYAVGDSIVVFQDMIGGYLKYYYQDEVKEISMVVGDYPLSANEVGENLFVYKDNAGNNSVFWRGKFYNLFSSNLAANFHAGQDVVAFNDPQNMTFTIFDNGYIVDAEGQFALKYKCGDNFVYYQDAAETHKVYREEDVQELGFDLQNIFVNDSMVIFEDVGITRIWYNSTIYSIQNFKVTNYQADGGIMAYENQWGGVSAFVRGKNVEITKTQVEEFTLVGNTILLKYSPTAYSVWWKGEIYQF